jgi:hypothetical protein
MSFTISDWRNNRWVPTLLLAVCCHCYHSSSFISPSTCINLDIDNWLDSPHVRNAKPTGWIPASHDLPRLGWVARRWVGSWPQYTAKKCGPYRLMLPNSIFISHKFTMMWYLMFVLKLRSLDLPTQNAYWSLHAVIPPHGGLIHNALAIPASWKWPEVGLQKRFINDT